MYVCTYWQPRLPAGCRRECSATSAVIVASSASAAVASAAPVERAAINACTALLPPPWRVQRA
eukprot:4952794-Prymnesium_polylepis.1